MNTLDIVACLVPLVIILYLWCINLTFRINKLEEEKYKERYVARHFYELGKQQMTLDDIKRIIIIHRGVLAEHPDRIMGSEENYKDTLMRFIENNKN